MRAYQREVAATVARLREQGVADPVAAALGGVARAVARIHGVEDGAAGLALLRRAAPAEVPPPPPALARPDLLGELHESLLAPAGRRSAGAHYTPAAIADGIVARALDGLDGSAPAICDPAVGGGAFLLAVARRLAADGVPMQTAVAGLHGVDRDELAVDVAATALGLLALTHGAAARPQLRVGDALALRGADELGVADGFDAVVGNPPFLGQLARATARSAEARARLRERFGGAAGGYADAALLFVLLGLDLVRPRGRVALIVPESLLAARDAAAGRAAVATRAWPRWLWRDGGRAFAANVRACAVVWERGEAPTASELARSTGPDFEPAPPLALAGGALRAGSSWGWLVADLLGGPPIDLDLDSSFTLDVYATATADFRDQYYGLAPYVADGLPETCPKLVTVGMLDPARCLWGQRPVRYARRRFERPRVDLRRLNAAGGALAGWAEQRLVPKVVLATQTRVLEPAVDERGTWLPSVPAITVVPREDRLWHVAAALASPVAAAWALRETAGTALGASAIKLGARHVRALPAPAEGAAWNEAAAGFRAASRARSGEAWSAGLRRSAVASCRAYGLGEREADVLVGWWAARVPPWRSAD